MKWYYWMIVAYLIILPCFADVDDLLKPLEKPSLANAKIVLKNLNGAAKSAEGTAKEELLEMALAIKGLFTADYRVASALKTQIKSEKEARKHDKSARDWMEPTRMNPRGRPEHARASVLKAEKCRKTAADRVVKTRQILREEMRKVDALILTRYDSGEVVSTVILVGVIDAMNERSLEAEKSFRLTVSKNAIKNLREFLANADRWLKGAKAAETAMNYEKAFRLFTKARDLDGRKRCSLALAKILEKEKIYGSACDYYEIANDFSSAARIRKEHPELLKDSFVKLNAEDLYAKIAPCCVLIRGSDAKSKWHGTGFFFKRGGYILTNNHVVGDSVKLEVETSEGKKYTAKILAKSKTPDLAVIKIDIKGHDIAKLGNAESVKIGTSVVLIGYPVKDLATATLNAGIVSNTNRFYANNPCFQLDVSANHGNSGGPALLSNGRVIGVLTFGLGDSGIDRFNFAIRVDAVRKFLLKEMGKDFAEN